MCWIPGDTVENTTGIALRYVRIDSRRFFFTLPVLTWLCGEESKEQWGSVAKFGMMWLGFELTAY